MLHRIGIGVLLASGVDKHHLGAGFPGLPYRRRQLGNIQQGGPDGVTQSLLHESRGGRVVDKRQKRTQPTGHGLHILLLRERAGKLQMLIPLHPLQRRKRPNRQRDLGRN